MVSNEKDVIRAQETLQKEQNLLSQAEANLRASPNNQNFKRLVDARKSNVAVFQDRLNNELTEFRTDQGFSFFELGARREQEARAEAERQAQARAEADRRAREQAEAERIANLQAELDRQAEQDRLAELERINQNQGGIPDAVVPTPPPVETAIPDPVIPSPPETQNVGQDIDNIIGVPQTQGPPPDRVVEDDFVEFFDIPRSTFQERGGFSQFGSRKQRGQTIKQRRTTRKIAPAPQPRALSAFDISPVEPQRSNVFGTGLFTLESITGLGARQRSRQEKRKQQSRGRVISPDDIFRF